MAHCMFACSYIIPLPPGREENVDGVVVHAEGVFRDAAVLASSRPQSAETAHDSPPRGADLEATNQFFRREVLQNEGYELKWETVQYDHSGLLVKFCGRTHARICLPEIRKCSLPFFLIIYVQAVA